MLEKYFADIQLLFVYLEDVFFSIKMVITDKEVQLQANQRQRLLFSKLVKPNLVQWLAQGTSH